MSDSAKAGDPQSTGKSIQMLKRYLGDGKIAPLLAVLEALAEDPQNEKLVER